MFYKFSILDQRDESSSDELVLNTMATVNNLSFYSVKTSAILAKPILVAECKFIVTNSYIIENFHSVFLMRRDSY